MPGTKLSSGRYKVPSIKQETPYYCGPAVAAMTLKGRGVSETQDDLWDEIRDEAARLQLPACEQCGDTCVEWFTAPEALRGTLGSHVPFAIKLVSESDVAATDQAIVWSVTQHAAACALVYGWLHWLVVYGFKASAEPMNVDDTGYVLQGFHLRDPAPSEPAQRYVTANQWRNDYMTGVVCGRFRGRFVAVCDPDERQSKGGPSVPSPPPKGSEIQSVDVAKRNALDGIKEAGLLDDLIWQRGLERTQPGEPLLVQRLDRPESFYYLVPFVRTRGKGRFKRRQITAQAIVDARSGAFSEAQVVDRAGRSFPAPLSEERALAALTAQRLDVPGWRPHARLMAEGLTVAKTSVWKPCTQSLSPYLVFTLVVFGPLRFYVRSDGEVFTSLTEGTAGA